MNFRNSHHHLPGRMYENSIVTRHKITVNIIPTGVHWDSHVQKSSYHANCWNRKKP